MSKFVPADRDQPFLLPPDLRDWLPEENLAHFVMEAVESGLCPVCDTASLSNTPMYDQI